jgi:hypothetical protein
MQKILLTLTAASAQARIGDTIAQGVGSYSRKRTHSKMQASHSKIYDT